MIFNVKNLTKRFGSITAVDNLSFHVKSGDILGFVGPNGAGKTTTLRMLATLELPNEGEVEIDGASIISRPEIARKCVGFVPDSLTVQKDITVHEYLDFYARLYAFKNPERRKLVNEIEEFTNLVGIREKFIDVLSKGMKQRVSIARALLNDPDIILMDEPAAGLDPRARIELRELLKILAKKNKMILISSHILTELDEICTSTMIIERGKLLKFGEIHDIVDELNVKTTKRTVVLVPLENTESLLNVLLVEPNITNVNTVGRAIEFIYDGDEKNISDLVARLFAEGYKLIEFKIKKQNLESVFMNITKGEVQ
ncbi:MAG: putative ABC transporter ATP-binding protein YxlF [bacterium ADurb.Bin157]|jgi:ABC-2 type transport system ATP-binding protein|nr:ABC transporter ATP-binding protein [Candidatus Riflebacteria bacterium]OQB50603.1 MAG: putative ABC transporter ATP-binding protein YxlF [bacterium ADurb.Bin157]